MNVTRIAKSTPPPGPLPDESGRGARSPNTRFFSKCANYGALSTYLIVESPFPVDTGCSP